MPDEQRLLSYSEIVQVRPPESPIERMMLDILSTGFDLDVRPQFFAADTIEEVRAALREHPEIFSRARLVVHPQVRVGSYRVDFLVTAIDHPITAIDAFDDFEMLILECDGKEFHGFESGRVGADMRREAEIKRKTDLEILRFSGAELQVRSAQVMEVIGAYLEARFAYRRIARVGLEHLVRVHGYSRDEVQNMLPEIPAPIGRVIAAAREVAMLPVMRHEYQSSAAAQTLREFRTSVADMRAWLDDWRHTCVVCDEP